MKHVIAFASAGVIAGLVAFPASAADREGNFALRGFGAQTCGNAVKSLEASREAIAPAMAWLLGYSTAFNRMQPDTFDVSPVANANPLLKMIIGVCRTVPDRRVETVAFDVLRTLAAARVTTDTPMVETRSGERIARVRQETLLAMQNRLKQAGYLQGAADGLYGPGTEAALKAFQSAQNLPVTGVADAATVVRLLVELPARQQ